MFSVAQLTRRRDKCVGLPGAGWCHKVERWLIFQPETVKIGQKKSKSEDENLNLQVTKKQG